MKRTYLFLFLLGLGHWANAHHCLHAQRQKQAARTTVADLAENDYDVHFVKLDIAVTNTSTSISGSGITQAKVVAPTMQDYVFELSPQLTIDSAKFNGQPVSVLSNGFVQRIAQVNLTQNSNFEVQIWYHGQPTGGAGFFSNGILHGNGGALNTPVTHTVSAAVHSRDWWPCKQSLQDKIDSADLWIAVPNGIEVASNGLLKNTTPLPNGQKRFEWYTRYPVDYYLLSFAAAPYQQYNYHMQFAGGNDSMLIQNYLYPDPTVLQQHQDELDSIALMINHFSDIFGKYPYDKEKFGICQAPLGGGMENQTMVSLGSLDSWLIAHELAHQWWGNNVTCATLKDMWLNEGWATYCEQLFAEYFQGPTVAKAMRTANFNNVVGLANGSVYVSDTTDEFRIYDGRLTYDKGGAVAHMLRFLINNDGQFFDVLRQYHQQFKFATATTDDFKNVAEAVTGLQLDTFFNQWVYQQGYPIYGLKWFQDGAGQVFLRLSQSSSASSSVPVFKMPLEIRLVASGSDTVIRLLNDQNEQDYSFYWSKTMIGAQIDPKDQIVNQTGTITKDPTLSVDGLAWARGGNIYPNPTKDSWQVTQLAAGYTLQLCNMSGQEVWKGVAAGNTLFVPAAQLAPGHYVLRITPPNGQSVSWHVQKD